VEDKQRAEMLSAPAGPNFGAIQAECERYAHIEDEGQPLYLIAKYCSILAEQMIYKDERKDREKKFADFKLRMDRLVAALTPKGDSVEKGKDGQDG
jgi:hypothetical protein